MHKCDCGKTFDCHAKGLGSIPTGTQDFHYLLICIYLVFLLMDNANFSLTVDAATTNTGVSATWALLTLLH